MLRIGLTGGIAAGKSVVAQHLAGLGAVLVDADVLARAALERGSTGLDEVVRVFGRGVLATDGALDRPALGRLVFADAVARERLNAIVHPRVRAAAAELLAGAPDDAVVVEDIPLLVETGQAGRFHLVVVVDAPDEVRIERMVRARGMARTDAEQRIAAQVSRTDRLREADAVLANDREPEDLLASTDALWHGRILPFRANLVAGRAPAGTEVEPAAAGLVGTSGLRRRMRAKLAAALPPGASVDPDEATGRRDEADGALVPPWPAVPAADRSAEDVSAAELRVTVDRVEDLPIVSGAVASAGFPRVEGPAGTAGDGRSVHPTAGHPTAVHHTADPALDVTVLVGLAAGTV